MGPALGTVSTGRLSAEGLNMDESSNGEGDSMIEADVMIDELRRTLESERKDREETEKEASRVIRSYKKKVKQMIKEKDDQLDDQKHLILQLLEKNTDLEQTIEEMTEEMESLREIIKKSRDEARQAPQTRGPSPLVEHIHRELRSRGCSPHTTPHKSERLTGNLNREIDDLKEVVKAKDDEIRRLKERIEFKSQINFELREDKLKLNTDLTEATSKLATARTEISAEFNEKMTQLKKNIETLEGKVSSSESEVYRLNSSIKDMKSSLADKDKVVKKLEEEVKTWKARCDQYQKEKAAEIEKEKSSLLKELRTLRENLDKKSEEYKKQEKETKALKDVAAEIDKQVEQYDKLLSKSEAECSKFKDQNRRLELEKDQLKFEVKKVNEMMENEKMKFELEKGRLEKKIKELEDDLKNEKEKFRNIRRELDQERNENDVNVRKVQDLQEQIDLCVREADDAEKALANVREDCLQIKEEAACHISEILSQKAKVNQLTAALADAEDRIDYLEEHIRSMLTAIEQERKEHEIEVFSLKERLRQHLALENEMATKLEKIEKKKKPLIGIKSPRTPLAGHRAGLIGNVGQLESEFQKYQNQIRQLQNQAIRYETELADLRMQRAMKPIHGQSVDAISQSSKDASAPPPPYVPDGEHTDRESVISCDDNLEVISDDDTDSITTEAIRRLEVIADVHHGASSATPEPYPSQDIPTSIKSIRRRIEEFSVAEK